MTAKERIHAVLETIGDDYLEELYEVVRVFAASRNGAKKGGIMEKLKRVKIQAPSDFAENLDQYTSGAKRVEDNLH